MGIDHHVCNYCESGTDSRECWLQKPPNASGQPHWVGAEEMCLFIGSVCAKEWTTLVRAPLHGTGHYLRGISVLRCRWATGAHWLRDRLFWASSYGHTVIIHLTVDSPPTLTKMDLAGVAWRRMGPWSHCPTHPWHRLAFFFFRVGGSGQLTGSFCCWWGLEAPGARLGVLHLLADGACVLGSWGCRHALRTHSPSNTCSTSLSDVTPLFHSYQWSQFKIQGSKSMCWNGMSARACIVYHDCLPARVLDC